MRRMAALLALALLAAPAMAQTPSDVDGVVTEGRSVAVTVRFPPLPLPVAVAPPPAPQGAPVLSSLVWIERPSAEDFAREYPPAALNAGTAGRITLDCIVNQDGRLSCAVVAEEPEGQGFGEAALRISRHFRLAPQTQDGRPTAGGRTRIPISFRLQ